MASRSGSCVGKNKAAPPFRCRIHEVFVSVHLPRPEAPAPQPGTVIVVKRYLVDFREEITEEQS